MASFDVNAHGLPVVMSVTGDTYTDGCRISAILWEAASTSGDVIEVVTRDTGMRVWKGRTNDTQTYLGVGFGIYGVPAPRGFKLATIGSGTVSVYLLEV